VACGAFERRGRLPLIGINLAARRDALWWSLSERIPPMTAPSASLSRASAAEEIANSVTHGVGAVLSVAGLVVLVAWAAAHGGPLALAAAAVFGTTLILVYTASTLYHAIPFERARPVLRALDHVAIFLLIAGTYTPFTLLALPPSWGWTLFVLIWALAIAGIAMEFTRPREGRKLAAALYVAMGWIALVAIVPLRTSLPNGGFALLLAGGAAYTLGVPFYLLHRVRWHHAIWHVFVLAGSVLQYLAVLLYVLPGAR
jgi:hemolysin III